MYLANTKRAVSTSFEFRPYSTKGVEMFRELVLQVDWSTTAKIKAADSAEALNDLLKRLVDASFPVRTRKIKSTDAPWFNRECRVAVARKGRIYKAEGKSQKYIDV